MFLFNVCIGLNNCNFEFGIVFKNVGLYNKYGGFNWNFDILDLSFII